MADWHEKRKLERALAEELNSAQLALRQACAELRDSVAAIPSGIPAPDSSLRIQKTGREAEAAYARWKKAMDRWRRFVVEGAGTDAGENDSANAANTTE